MTSETLEKTFGEWVQSQRNQMQLDTRQFAKRTGVSNGTVSRLENGRTHILLDTVIRICSSLGMSSSDFAKQFLPVTTSPFLLQSYEETANNGSSFLTLKYVEYFLRLFRRDPKLGSSILVDLLNNISYIKTGVLGNSNAEEAKFFVVEDIKKILASDSALIMFELKYPSEIQNKTILEIYKYGGVLTPADAGKYVENLRRQRQLTLDDLGKTMKRSQSLLSRLETGLIGRIKLLDVVSLDNFWQQEGRLFAIYWRAGEFNVKITHSTEWTEGESKIGSVLVTIARWQQFLKWDDNSWLYDLYNRIQLTSSEVSPVILG